MKKILIVDDDVHIGEMLKEALTQKGYSVSQAYSGTEALLALSAAKPDLVLLDLMLPGLTGEEVLPRLTGIPVIVVSAKAEVSDKVSLLLGGAADYVTKPFHLSELLARVAVQLRGPASHSQSAVLEAGGLALNPDTRTVSAKDAQIRLTRTECAILKLLMQNPTQVVTRSLLLERIAEDTPDCTESSLKTHVSNLRKKLRDISGRDCIEAVWGIGFKLREG